MKKAFVLSLCAALCAVASARAEAVYDNITYNGVYGVDTGTAIGQSFVTGNTALSLNSFLFTQSTDGTNYAFTTGETVALYGNNPVTNTPTVALASFNQPFNNRTNITQADVSTTTILTANTRYWLVLSAPTGSTVSWSFFDSSAASNYVAASKYGVSLPAANSSFETSNGNTIYYAFTDGVQSIYLDASVAVAPEPSTWVMLAFGGAGAAFLLVRRARAARAA